MNFWILPVEVLGKGPDFARAAGSNKRLVVRNPGAVRPWQHVLEALGGYLMIAERLFGGDASAATGWNFGPSDDDAKPVSWIVDNMLAKWQPVALSLFRFVTGLLLLDRKSVV